MSRRLGVLCFLSILFVPFGVAHAAPPLTMSSHGPEFFSQLLPGRVWVFHSPVWKLIGKKGVASALYHAPDGELLRCSPVGGKATWNLIPGGGLFSQYNYQPTRIKPDPKRVGWHFAIIYNGETGRLHTESLNESGSKFVFFMDGWIQDTWPAVMKNTCPDVDVPVPINPKQTATAIAELREQDPHAAIRKFPGYEDTVLGATGLAVSGGKPTLTKKELFDFLAGQNGMILRSGRWHRYVLVLHEKKDQLWKLKGRTDEIEDIVYLTPSKDGNRIRIRFQKSNKKFTYHVGYPFWFKATGERYAAMKLMDWLIAQGDYVELPFMDREAVSFRFLEDGVLQAAAAGGGHIGGVWRWSRGRLVLSLEGVKKAAGFEWPKLARHVGWPDAPPLVERKKKGDRDSGNRDTFKRPER